MKTDDAVLLGPGVRRSSGKPGDGQAGRRNALDDRRQDAGRYEGEGSQQAGVPFAPSFLPGDLRKGCASPVLTENFIRAGVSGETR